MRVVDTPITELGFAGVGVGAAMVGPAAGHRVHDLELRAAGASTRSSTPPPRCATCRAARSGSRSSSAGPGGAALQLAAPALAGVRGWYAHIPGLKVVTPATPADAKGLLKSAIRDDNPVIFIEGEMLYNTKGEVPDGEYLIPLGKADVKRAGDRRARWSAHAKMVARGAARRPRSWRRRASTPRSMDLRTMRPLDAATIVDVGAEDQPLRGGRGGLAVRRRRRAGGGRDPARGVRRPRRAGAARAPAPTCRCRTTSSSRSAAKPDAAEGRRGGQDRSCYLRAE